MPTPVTKSLGKSGFGRDYTDFAVLEAAISPVSGSLVTDDQVWTIEVYNDDNTSISDNWGDQGVNFATACDATRNITIKPATGEGWIDSFLASPYAIKFDPAKGAALENTSHRGAVLSVSNGCDYFTIRGMQCRAGWRSLYVDTISGSALVEDNILATTGNQDGVAFSSAAGVLRNNFVIVEAGGGALFAGGHRFGAYPIVHNNTFVRLGASASGDGMSSDPSFPDIECINNVFVNCAATFAAHITAAGNGIDYNASTATLSLGTHNRAGITASNEFNSVSATLSATDLRRQAGADLSGFGLTTLGGFGDDVFDTARGAAWDIGAQEYAAGGGPPAFANPLALLGVGRAV